jgi:hypothetical protein
VQVRRGFRVGTSSGGIRGRFGRVVDRTLVVAASLKMAGELGNCVRLKLL